MNAESSRSHSILLIKINQKIKDGDGGGMCDYCVYVCMCDWCVYDWCMYMYVLCIVCIYCIRCV